MKTFYESEYYLNKKQTIDLQPEEFDFLEKRNFKRICSLANLILESTDLISTGEANSPTSAYGLSMSETVQVLFSNQNQETKKAMMLVNGYLSNELEKFTERKVSENEIEQTKCYQELLNLEYKQKNLAKEK